MLARLGWIGTALAVGMLLQVVVQISLLHWLPDFPVYLGLALLAAGIAVLAAPIAAGVAARKTLMPSEASRWPLLAALGCFALLALAHGILAVQSSSSALEWWRNVTLWPALLMGVFACVAQLPRWPAMLLLWPLGEAVTAILACWYAPSLGESQSLRAYQYVLFAGLISVLSLLAFVIVEPRVRQNWSLWAVVIAAAALGLICLSQSDAERAPPLMLGASALRLGVLVAAANVWLKLAGECPRDAIGIKA